MEYYVPKSNVSIDKVIMRFSKRSRDTFKILSKLINKDYKAFCLADYSYVFDFRIVLRINLISNIEDIDKLSHILSIVLSLAKTLPY